MPKTKTISKSPAVKKTVTKPKAQESPRLLADMYDTKGKKQGSFKLPKEIFGQKVNDDLLSQAIRVYEYNLNNRSAHTKTRSEKRGGGAKPWRQKGTGRARAGSRRSPLWVGGGVTHGPRYTPRTLSLPKKMKQKALIHALSEKANSNSIKIISNLEKIEPKTKNIVLFLKKLETHGASLFVLSGNSPTGGKNVKLASRNIQKTFVDNASDLNAYEIIKHRNIFLSKEAVGKLS